MKLPGCLKLHHLGIVVPNIQASRPFFREVLHYEERTGIIHDPIQTAFVQFLALPATDHYLELVAPDGDSSKLRIASRKGSSLHHLCYSCESTIDTIKVLQRSGCLLIQEPVPAVAFDGRRIAWLMTPEGLLVELVERAPHGSF